MCMCVCVCVCVSVCVCVCVCVFSCLGLLFATGRQICSASQLTNSIAVKSHRAREDSIDSDHNTL